MTAVTGEPWKITGDERAKHDGQFYNLKPLNGFITGEQARDFFVLSGLSREVLGNIWSLADINGDGKMDKLEFSVAMYLIKKKLQGYNLPKVLPASLKVAPTPTMGSLGMPSGPMISSLSFVGTPSPMNPSMMPTQSSELRRQMSLSGSALTALSTPLPILSNGAAVQHSLQGYGTHLVSTSSAAPSDWVLPQSSRLKYTQLFNAHDHHKYGFLSGAEARGVLMQTGLSQPTLAQIWTLSDVDKSGKLTCDQFCIAMHLSDMARVGCVLPSTLPPDLMVPFNTRRASLSSWSGTGTVPAIGVMPQNTGQLNDAFGNLLTGMATEHSNFPMPLPPTEETFSIADTTPVTFEDKRKENFDKGQAELERRRMLLQEQLKAEESARLEKERKEAQRKESIRLEQEAKRQEEYQRQLEKQRQMELEREEQRRKLLEQREQARKELERQRLSEWDKQRVDQLAVEKQREYEQLTTLKSMNSDLSGQLQSLDGKKTDLKSKISQVRDGVLKQTSDIGSMKVDRDTTLTDIECSENEILQLNRSLPQLNCEHDELKTQLEAKLNPVTSDILRTITRSLEVKKGNVDKLRQHLKSVQDETEGKLAEIDMCTAESKSLESLVDQLQNKINALHQKQRKANSSQSIFDTKRPNSDSRSMLHSGKIQTKTSGNSLTQDSWFDFNTANFSSCSKMSSEDLVPWSSAFGAFSSAHTTGNIWGSSDLFANQSSGLPKQVKYRIMFDFDARTDDELKIMCGDTVMVWEGYSEEGMEEWYRGELDGNAGWFPKAYAECVTGDDTTADLSQDTRDSSLMDAFSAFHPVLNAANQLSSVPHSDSHLSVEATAGKIVNAPDSGMSEAVQVLQPDNQLSFFKGSDVVCEKEGDNWWELESSKKVEWLPTESAGQAECGNLAASSLTTSTDAPIASTNDSLSAKASPVPEPDGESCVALYSYSSAEAGDLNFNEGDVIRVTRKQDDWWTGVLGDQIGIFPWSYVKRIVKPAHRNLEKPEIAMVIAPYNATGNGQLSLETGNVIHVRQKSPRGWWEGELQARGHNKKFGWFPANYVKLLGSSSARSTPTNNSTLLTSQYPSVDGVYSDTPPPQSTSPSPSQLSSSSEVQRMVTVYPYTAQNDDELSFDKDAVITVLSRDNANWWRGEFDGKTGMFPSNYVTVTDSWLNDSVRCKLSKAERQRQNYIQELITTEDAYNSDMALVLGVFCHPLREAKVLTGQEADDIFVNWNELLICNKKFLQALRVRKKMCGKGKTIFMIGDILCENLPHMTPYVRFCSCQLSAAQLLQWKTDNSPEFVEIHKKCVRNRGAKGMPLSSFLLKPMQRITKYPLLIEKILKHTPSDHADFCNLEEALQKSQELCSQVNEGVRERENSDRLEWIQRHVHCDGLSEDITFNSVTNCLGARKIVHMGLVYKLKSNKELFAFLFNDFLLLTVPPRVLGSSFVASHIFDMKTKDQYRMYRTPIVLNEVTVKSGGDSDSDSCHQFRVSKVDMIYILRSATETERDQWVKHLLTASQHYIETERRKHETASSLKVRPIGRLLVIIEEGVRLRSTNSTGKSDPYCEVSMGSQEHCTCVISNSLNPKWNDSMQFTIRDLHQDVLCITVYDRDLFSPNDFLGRTEVQIREVLEEARVKKGPITKRLLLHEVDTGEVIVKLDLQLYKL